MIEEFNSSDYYGSESEEILDSPSVKTESSSEPRRICDLYPFENSYAKLIDILMVIPPDVTNDKGRCLL